jgi:hypothetical protein
VFLPRNPFAGNQLVSNRFSVLLFVKIGWEIHGFLKGQLWWHMPVIPATWEAEIGGLNSEATLGKS